MYRTIAWAGALTVLLGTHFTHAAAGEKLLGRRLALPFRLHLQQKAKNQKQEQNRASSAQASSNRSQAPTGSKVHAATVPPGVIRPRHPGNFKVNPRVLPDLAITYVSPNEPGKLPKVFYVSNRGYATVNGIEAELLLQNYYGQITKHPVSWNGSLAAGQTIAILLPEVGTPFDRRTIRVDPANKVRESNERNNSWFIDRVN